MIRNIFNSRSLLFPSRRCLSRKSRRFLCGAAIALACLAPLRADTAKIEEIGSLRHARVAIPQTTEKKELTYFAGSVSTTEREELAKIAPNLKIVTGLSPAEALARAGEAHGIDVRYATPAFLEKATQLAWVQAMSAGVEGVVRQKAIAENDRIVLTNHRGVHGPAIADHAMAMLLMLTRDLRHYADNQAEKRWGRGGSELAPVALDGRTMLVVGIGGIGGEIAKRAKAFGMTVWATRRSEAPKPDYVDRVELSEKLLELLPGADVIAIAAPLTPETQGLFNQEAFAAMKQGSYLINIARGGIVDSAALVDALRGGKLAGAGLDVTDPEPLPASSPLWEMRNVIITPHVAAQAEVTGERRQALMRENWRRFAAGEPLLNVVDKKAGY